MGVLDEGLYLQINLTTKFKQIMNINNLRPPVIVDAPKQQLTNPAHLGQCFHWLARQHIHLDMVYLPGRSDLE